LSCRQPWAVISRARLTLPYALVTGEPVNVDIWGGWFFDLQ
jgi:hypothetical protein